jgi:hypothetical protein
MVIQPNGKKWKRRQVSAMESRLKSAEWKWEFLPHVAAAQKRQLKPWDGK